MLRDKDIICISSIDWDFVWQGHQEIMSTFAKAGNRVLFVENTGARSAGIKDFSRLKKRLFNWRRGGGGVRQVQENIDILSPLIFPFPYLRLLRYINRRILLKKIKSWLKSVSLDRPIFWVYLPTQLSVDIINSIAYKLVIYCCIDNFSVSSPEASKIIESEPQLIKNADLVFVTGKKLYEHCSQYRKDGIYLFHEGVNIERFMDAYNKSTRVPDDLANIPEPIIGYVGSIHKWLDKELIKYVSQNNPNYSFVFVGPFYTDISSLKGIKNIYFLGEKNKEVLPFYIKYFQICIIPYLIRQYTENVYPTKLNEYLAMGKPVISTNLPEVVFFNQEYGGIINIVSAKEEFSSCLAGLLNTADRDSEQRRIEVARNNSWGMRIERMSGKIQEIIEIEENYR